MKSHNGTVYIKKNRNKRSDHLATRETAYVFYSALKIGYLYIHIYKQNTHTHKVSLKTFYFNFDYYKIVFPSVANVNEFREEMFAELGCLPVLNIVSVSNIPHLSNVDIDLHMPSDTNFGYYTPHDHSSNNIIERLSNHKAFSAMHCNIRSLSANHDNLIHMLHIYLGYICV